MNLVTLTHRTFDLLSKIVAAACSTACLLTLTLQYEANAGHFFTDDFSDGTRDDDAPVSWEPGTELHGDRDASSGDLVQTPRVPGEAMSTFAVLNGESEIYGDVSLTTQLRIHDANGDFATLFSRSIGAPLVGATLFGGIQPTATGAEVALAAAFNNSVTFLARKNVDLNVVSQDVLLRFDVQGDQMSLWAWDPSTSQPSEPALQTSVPTAFPNQNGTIGVENFQTTTYRFIQVAPVPEPSTGILFVLGSAASLSVYRRRRDCNANSGARAVIGTVRGNGRRTRVRPILAN